MLIAAPYAGFFSNSGPVLTAAPYAGLSCGSPSCAGLDLALKHSTIRVLSISMTMNTSSKAAVIPIMVAGFSLSLSGESVATTTEGDGVGGGGSGEVGTCGGAVSEEDGGIATERVEGKGAGWESLDSSSNN